MYNWQHRWQIPFFCSPLSGGERSGEYSRERGIWWWLTGLCDPIACSIVGGGVLTQNSGYKSTRLRPLFYLGYFFYRPQNMALFPPLPPPRFIRVPCPPRHIARTYSLSLPLLTPIRPFLVYLTVHLQQSRLSPVICPSEVFSLPTDFRTMPCCPWFPVQRTEVWRFNPQPVRLVVLGSGVGGEA